MRKWDELWTLPVRQRVSLVQAEERRMENHDDNIRLRAYQLWLGDGSPPERADEHWYRAERELMEHGALDHSTKAVAEIPMPYDVVDAGTSSSH